MQIKVTNSEFNYNSDGSGHTPGLYLDTLGAITLDGVSASHNYGDGVDFYANKGGTITNSVFNNNTGIVAYQSGIRDLCMECHSRWKLYSAECFRQRK